VKIMTVYCLYCNQAFHAFPSRIKAGWGKYCSRKCQGLHHAIFVVCKQCGKTFRISPSKQKAREGLYCSKKCMGLAERDRVKKICQYCGKEFEITRYNNRIGKGQFCSRDCRNKNGYSEEHRQKIADSRTGEKHPNWKGGIALARTRYWRSDEYQEWRTAVFERDDYTCQRCLGRGGYLHAHHIIPYCISPEERFNVDNGATLCKECHDYIHSKEMITVHNYNPSICRPSYEKLYECILSNSGKATSYGYANPEPSPLWEGVETIRQTPLVGEEIVQTTNDLIGSESYS